MSQYIGTIVVGCGQAGLSVSWHLKQVGREHLVLDHGRIGDTWRQRWDSFCLVTPNGCCQLPGFPYGGDEPEGFMLRDQIVDHVERFAKSFEPPYRGSVEVRRDRRHRRDRDYHRLDSHSPDHFLWSLRSSVSEPGASPHSSRASTSKAIEKHRLKNRS